MNGNFEVDRGSYPYTATQIGDQVKVMHTPTQQVVFDLPMPLPLAANVALRLNTQYHAAKAGGAPFNGSLANVVQICRAEQRAAFERNELTGAQYMQLKQQTYMAAFKKDPYYAVLVGDGDYYGAAKY